MYPENIDQADAALLNQKVEIITGHKLDNSYILQGVIEYRENVAISTTGLNFDVFRGRFKTGEAIAIKLYRTELKNDGNGLEFVKVFIHGPFVSALLMSIIIENTPTSPIMEIIQQPVHPSVSWDWYADDFSLRGTRFLR